MRFWALLLVSLCFFIFVLLVSCAVPPGGVEMPISMEEAIDIVEDEILSNLPGDLNFVCLKLDGALQKGTVIKEVLEGLTPPQRSGISSNGLTLQEPVYFFLLDKAPYSYFLHEMEYILVYGDESVSTHTAYSWPSINGETPSHLLMDYRDVPSDYIIDSNFDFTPVQHVTLVVNVPWLAPEQEGFIIVQGLMEGERCYEDAVRTYLNAISVFRAYIGDRDVLFDGLVQNDAKRVLEKVDDFVADGATVITIFIIAHGGVNTVRLGGQTFTAQQFRDKFQEYSNVKFNLILGSCHSGSFVDYMNDLDNVAVMSACSRDEGATTDVDWWGSTQDYNPPDTGSEWTSSLLEAVAHIISNEDLYENTEYLAYIYNIPTICAILWLATDGALGNLPGYGLNNNLDLTNRVGHTTPRSYFPWESVIW